MSVGGAAAPGAAYSSYSDRIAYSMDNCNAPQEEPKMEELENALTQIRLNGGTCPRAMHASMSRSMIARNIESHVKSSMPLPNRNHTTSQRKLPRTALWRPY